LRSKDTVIYGKGKVRGAVNGRKRDRVLVLNPVSQSIVAARRGKHATHVVGMRLREENVRESTVAHALWHEHRSITRHYYSVAQIDERVTALDLIVDEHGRGNKSLQMLQLEAKQRVQAESLKSLAPKQKGQAKMT
jgi:hypothetical protein